MNKSEELKYDPGNLGDVLKHSWLIEVVEWVVKKKISLRYGDSFCGCYKYQNIKDYVKLRFSCKLKNSRLFSFQEKYLIKNEYLGSAALINELSKHYKINADILIYDKDVHKVNTFNSHLNIKKLTLNDGYEILISELPFDIIFLDPYSKFIPQHKEILPSIIKRASRSSILLFILNLAKSTVKYNEFLENLRKNLPRQQSAIIGRIPAHPFNKPESKYHFEMLYIPELALDMRAKKELFPKLHDLTMNLNMWVQEETCFTQVHKETM